MPDTKFRARLRAAGFIVAVLGFAGAGCGGDNGGGPGPGATVLVTIASGQGTGGGTVAGSGFSCQIVGGLQSGTCIKSFAANTQVTIAATPDSGSVFAGWGAGCPQTSSVNCLFTVTAAITITAKFSPQAITLATDEPARPSRDGAAHSSHVVLTRRSPEAQ